jgi:drug/metabolite transporter (DMT)-like permease
MPEPRQGHSRKTTGSKSNLQENHLLWVYATLAAAAAQTARNALQNSLTSTLGTVGATQVRFLYGFPFALIFLLLAATMTGEPVPAINPTFLVFVTAGSVAQIFGTALLLAAMQLRSFSVATAFTKTEAVQVAVFGLLLLGDTLTPQRTIAIMIASAGVFLIAVKPGDKWGAQSLRPALYGIASGALFALAAVGFRGGILALDSPLYFMQATTTLVWSLGLQTFLLGLWMLLFERTALVQSFRLWRRSLFAGFMGAFASQCWFIGFSLTAAVNVRTLGLIEVLFAQLVSRRLLRQHVSKREIGGLVLVVAGVTLLLAGV